MMANEAPIRFDAGGLAPVVVQDAETGDVLMVAFMNAEALAASRRTGRAHFWSRSRGKLWRKGETSGHEQIVEEIFVNCEQNSLLLKVRQIGAVCHEGYATCYYRRLNDDDSLTIIRERAFDPATVYGDQENLVALTRRWYDALAYLRDHDLEDVSRTSSLLRSITSEITSRIADELFELAGALDGTHGHRERLEDVVLEGSQVLYWVALASLRAENSWDDLRPDRALSTTEDSLSPTVTARLLRAEAASWTSHAQDQIASAPRCHAVFGLVAQATRAVGIAPSDLVKADLAEMRAKPYLAAYFKSEH
jgi:phosphoribosyl-AMP cyclohydrolase